jgi:predicted esterase
MVLVHGRGAEAASILSLTQEFNQPAIAYLAPQAAGNTWYPHSFLSPLANNEPGITSGMTAVAAAIERAVQAGISPEKIVLLGFSQGACLCLEFVARHAQRYGGVAGLSGGLIGPEGTPRHYDGSLAGTPVFLGCSDVDFHIPKERVQHSADVLSGLGAAVTLQLYPGMGHTINHDEIKHVRRLLAALT